MERLKSICLQYAAVTQWLITSSIDIPKTDTQSNTSHETKKSKNVKRRNLSQKLKLASEDKTLVEPILYVKILASKCTCMCMSYHSHFEHICRKFEKEFTNELRSLRPILSSNAQAEPYLTHLAQLILGVGRDQ